VSSAVRRRKAAEPVTPPNTQHGPDGRPHAEPAGRLPVSVMIGLALLPFAIPMFWLIAPFALGQPPVLSLATPVSLAVSASALCLAVVFTIDWSPATRVKGVLMLVGLAYLAGLGLYFLKKEMVDGAKKAIGTEERWKEVRQADFNYTVAVPRNAKLGDDPTLIRGRNLKCYRATERVIGRQITFVVGAAVDPAPAADGDEDQWFNAVGKSLGGLRNEEGVVATPIEPDGNVPLRGRQWVYEVGPNVRIVRVFRDTGRLYYLSVEGPNIDPSERSVVRFFESFAVTPRKDQPEVPAARPRK
jgi:hypothetical protein